jgi:hypothetical protein
LKIYNVTSYHRKFQISLTKWITSLRRLEKNMKFKLFHKIKIIIKKSAKSTSAQLLLDFFNKVASINGNLLKINRILEGSNLWGTAFENQGVSPFKKSIPGVWWG